MTSINVYASNLGWLFEDLLEAFALYPLESGAGIDVTASDRPRRGADAWICLRTDELSRSPDPSRTVVQVHDFWERDLGGASIGALSLVHDHQLDTVRNWNSSREPMVLPIGARRAFKLREAMPERFTVGWVGRNVIRFGESIKRPHLLRDAIEELFRDGVDVRTIALTPNASLGPRAEIWVPDRGPNRTPSFEQLQKLYHSIDVLVVTSKPEPGPLSIFEALRCGVPVVVMKDGPRPPLDTGWSPTWPVSGLGEYLRELSEESSRSWADAAKFRASMPYLQEDWIAANVRLAVEVASCA